LLVIAGLCLLIVPGIYLGMRYWAGVHFIVDRDVGFAEAFRLSSEFTAGNVMQSVFVGMYAMVAMLCALLTALLGPLVLVGLLLALPLNTLLWTVSFLLITRQPIPRMKS